MKNTVVTFKDMKDKGEKITMLTAYDYSTAKLVDAAGINSILVGDSLGNVMLGYEDTVSVTMEDMIHHGVAVSRGAKNALVITRVFAEGKSAKASNPRTVDTAWINTLVRDVSICASLFFANPQTKQAMNPHTRK